MNQFFRTRNECPVCGDGNSKIVVDRSFEDEALSSFLHEYYAGRIPLEVLEGASYRLAKCENCAHVFQKDILIDEKMADLYEVWISPQASLEKKQASKIDRFDLHASQTSAIGRLVKKSPNDIRVLEFGIGWGYWLLMAKAFGYRTFGAELSQPRIDFARSNGLEILSDLESGDHEPFDYIFSNQVFEHIPAPFDTLCLLRDQLAPKGYIHIAVPQGKRVRSTLSQDSWSPAKDAVHPLEHINCFIRRDLIALGKRAGLKICATPRYRLTSSWKGFALSLALQINNRISGTDILFQKP